MNRLCSYAYGHIAGTRTRVSAYHLHGKLDAPFSRPRRRHHITGCSGPRRIRGKFSWRRHLHPARLPLTPERMVRVNEMLQRTDASKEDFIVKARDGAELRGWKVRPKKVNGDWVILFHGIADNRTGDSGHAEFLLRHGYSVGYDGLHGPKVKVGGDIANLWLERAL